MYVVKKCDNYSRGQNKWKVIYTSPDKEGAISIFKQELRYELEADPNLDREQINRYLNLWQLDPQRYGGYKGNRVTSGHGDIYFSIMRSESVEHQTPAMRPDRTALLDSILN